MYRTGASGNHSFFKTKGFPGNLHGIRSRKKPFSQEHIDPQILKPLDRIMSADPSPKPSHALHHSREIHFHPLRNSDAKLVSVTNISHHPGGSNNAFRGHTTHIETIASQKAPLHKRNLCPQSCCARSRDQSGCSCSDHHQVITT